MENLLRDMPLFVEVAKRKSFTLAAESLDMYISTLSRRIAGLEQGLGVPLFLRSTRHVELTESGKVLYERCRYHLEEIESTYDAVAQNMTRAAGLVRVSVPAEVYHVYMWGMASQFAKKWPEISLNIQFSTRWVDLLAEPFDIDIRVGKLPDSELRARKLVSLEPALYVSREFLEHHPKPEKPRDLKDLPCIAMPQQGGSWVMHKGKKRETIPINAVHTVNTISLALEMAAAGIGVAWLAPSIAASPVLVSPDVFVNVLPGWTVPGIEINAVMANSQPPHRVRLFLDFLIDHFARMVQR